METFTRSVIHDAVTQFCTDPRSASVGLLNAMTLLALHIEANDLAPLLGEKAMRCEGESAHRAGADDPSIPRCPICGAAASAVCETVSAIRPFTRYDVATDTFIDDEGLGLAVHYDTAEARDNGRGDYLLCCPNNHQDFWWSPPVSADDAAILRDQQGGVRPEEKVVPEPGS